MASTTTGGIKLSKPDVTDQVTDTIKRLGDNFEAISAALYPIGCIYMSTVNKTPGFGTWEPIQGRFILGASSAYPAGSTGGEASHALTVSEMPRHNHSVLLKGQGSGGAGIDFSASGASGGPFGGGYIGETGSGAAHNNMPPYVAAYMWKRIA